jgi:hypothetical protein
MMRQVGRDTVAKRKPLASGSQKENPLPLEVKLLKLFFSGSM